MPIPGDNEWDGERRRPVYYTHGRWTVRAGHEDEFVALWRGLAEWSVTHLPEAVGAVLLRDRDHPNLFLSFGPWPSLEAIDDFRGQAQFGAFLAQMRPLLERVETSTLDEAASVGRLG
jgi:quinol monooxygenase YgiN